MKEAACPLSKDPLSFYKCPVTEANGWNLFLQAVSIRYMTPVICVTGIQGISQLRSSNLISGAENMSGC